MNTISRYLTPLLCSTLILSPLSLSKAEEYRLDKIPDDTMNYVVRGSFGNVLECWYDLLRTEEIRLKSKGLNPNKELVIGFDQEDLPMGTLSLSYWDSNINLHCEPTDNSNVSVTSYEVGEKYVVCKIWSEGCTK